MVSLRCKFVVQAEIEALGMRCTIVELGRIEMTENITQENINKLNTALKKTGLELLEDKKLIIVEKIRNLVIEVVHQSDEIPKINFSEYVSKKLNYNYGYLSRIFSETRNKTIEHYFISHKIEYVKELISYNQLNLSEIAFKLSYSSEGHLSKQFKKTTGITPTQFKNTKQNNRIPLGVL